MISMARFISFSAPLCLWPLTRHWGWDWEQRFTVAAVIAIVYCAAAVEYSCERREREEIEALKARFKARWESLR